MLGSLFTCLEGALHLEGPSSHRIPVFPDLFIDACGPDSATSFGSRVLYSIEFRH